MSAAPSAKQLTIDTLADDGKSDNEVEELVRRRHRELDQIDHSRALLLIRPLTDALQFLDGEMCLIDDENILAAVDEALEHLADRILRLEARGAKCKSRTDEIRRAQLFGDEPLENA